MKPTIQRIKNILENEELNESLQNLVVSNPSKTVDEYTIEEAYELWKQLQFLLLEEIKENRLDSLSSRRIKVIGEVLYNIQVHSSHTSLFISNVDDLLEQITLSNIWYLRIGKQDLKVEFEQLTKQKRRYSQLIYEIENSKVNTDYLRKNRNAHDQLMIDLETSKSKAQDIEKRVGAYSDEVHTELETVKEQLKQIKEIQKELNEKKDEIEQFHDEIEHSSARIIDLEERAKNVIAKESDITNLIKSAQEALKLGSTVGISSAFAHQHGIASNKKIYQGWVVGALLFLLIAVGLTVWIITGSGIEDPNSLSSILGRIVAVAITISAAAFCARQYVRQKNIAEDYAYKAVLAKSITAFTDEISDSDDDKNTQVSEYLKKVLHEIHKDPLRSRKDTMTGTVIDEKTINMLERVVKAVKA